MTVIRPVRSAAMAGIPGLRLAHTFRCERVSSSGLSRPVSATARVQSGSTGHRAGTHGCELRTTQVIRLLEHLAYAECRFNLNYLINQVAPSAL